MSKTNRLLLMMNILLTLILVLVLIQFMPKPANAATGNVTACADKKTGALRLATKACTKKENKVSWSAIGPAGATGPAGAAGGNSNLAAKTITLNYLGDPYATSPCGDGVAGVNEVSVFWWNISFADFYLNNSYYWKRAPGCSATIKVLE